MMLTALTVLTLTFAAPVEMDAPVVEMAAPIMVGPDARPEMDAPTRMPPPVESVLIGQYADGQIGWVLTPRSQPVPPVWVVPVSAGFDPYRMHAVAPAYPQAPAVRLLAR